MSKRNERHSITKIRWPHSTWVLWVLSFNVFLYCYIHLY